MNRFLNLALISFLFFSTSGNAKEKHASVAEGFERIELLSEVDAISPGVPFRVGVLFTLLPDYHTYWRGPGIVGVAPSFEWELPEGFAAEKTEWPAPEVVDMAGIKANGYHNKVLIITEITSPKKIEEDTISIELKSAWMACADSCHPGLGNFSITLPVQNAGAPTILNASVKDEFARSKKAIPPSAPGDWKWKVAREGSSIFLSLAIPEPSGALEKELIHFFCDDMQVDSNEQQATEFPHSGSFDLIQQLPSPEFAPKNPTQLSGLLFNAGGWPGINSNYVEISIPWPQGKSDHE